MLADLGRLLGPRLWEGLCAILLVLVIVRGCCSILENLNLWLSADEFYIKMG